MSSEHDKASENPYEAPVDKVADDDIPLWLWLFGIAGAVTILVALVVFVPTILNRVR